MKEFKIIKYERVQNHKILIENMKAFSHLKVNSIFHIVIIQQLWLMYSIDSMQYPSLNHLPNFPIQKVHRKKQKASNAFSSSSMK